jgi:TIR domain/Pentapeptide repeats (8 copies)
MANDEHVRLLKKGVDAWNEWRAQNRKSIQPNLGGADLREADLFQADLSGADLSGANLSGADLRAALLSGANLSGANLNGALLSVANLVGANLVGADLSGAGLSEANLNRADLTEASLNSVRLVGASLNSARLVGANLNGALLGFANLVGANLGGADLTEAILKGTVFGDTTLSDATVNATVKGLDQCKHLGPSIVDFQTLKNSGPLPIAFLRGVGLPDNLIEYLPSLLNDQSNSCFISYSSKDELFAERLHADLQNKGVRCWFAPHDMPIGAKIIDALDEAIRLRDKVLLILSEGAIASDWVEGEVTRALDEERTRKQVVLFPVRIDDAVMQTSEAWARLLRGQRNIGDFTRWKEHDSYQKSFEWLIRDLRVESEGGR